MATGTAPASSASLAGTAPASDGAGVGGPGIASPADIDAGGATAESWGGGASSSMRIVSEAKDGLPEVEVEVPGPPRPLGDMESQAPASSTVRPPSSPSMRTTQEHMRRV